VRVYPLVYYTMDICNALATLTLKVTKGEIMSAWYGDSKGHAEAGRKGGKSQGKRTNPGNFANDRDKAKRAGQKGGSARSNRE
jgi:general stress protein YciG